MSDDDEYSGEEEFSDEEYDYCSDSDGDVVADLPLKTEPLGAASFDVSAKPFLRRLQSHDTRGPKELTDQIESFIQTTIEELGTDRSSSILLLTHSLWNVPYLLQQYRSSFEFILKSAGVPFPKATATQTLALCEICYCDDIPMTEIDSIGCNHFFCKECLKQHISVSSGSLAFAKDRLFLTCPNGGCSMRIGLDVYTRYGLQENYDKGMFEHFVTSLDSAKYCPHPGCEQMVFGSVRKLTQVCGNDHRFCYHCGKVAHAPVTCDKAAAWLEKCDKSIGGEAEIGMVKETMSKTFKACPNPKCRALSELISGCMYVLCPSCQCNWCWKCGDWGGVDERKDHQPHHVYDCNKPVNKEWENQSAASLFENDGRFLWYLERKQNHMDGLPFAIKRRNLVVSQLKEDAYVDERVKQAAFKAVETVIEARHVLAWGYTFAFFIEDAQPRLLFEHSQKVVEELVEKLTAVTEKPMKEVAKSIDTSISLTEAVRESLKKFSNYVVEVTVADKKADQKKVGKK